MDVTENEGKCNMITKKLYQEIKKISEEHDLRIVGKGVTHVDQHYDLYVNFHFMDLMNMRDITPLMKILKKRTGHDFEYNIDSNKFYTRLTVTEAQA